MVSNAADKFSSGSPTAEPFSHKVATSLSILCNAVLVK